MFFSSFQVLKNFLFQVLFSVCLFLKSVIPPLPLDTDALCFEYKLRGTHQIILTMCKSIVVLDQTSGHSPTTVSKICTYRFLGKSKNIFWYYVVSWLPTVCNSIFLSQKWIPSAQQALRCCLDSLAKNYTEIDMHLKKNWSLNLDSLYCLMKALTNIHWPYDKLMSHNNFGT